MTTMITHELLMEAIAAKYPGILHGQDYVVGHPLDSETGEQNSNAFIMSWNYKGVPKPTDAEYAALLKDARDHIPTLQARNTKELRNQLLSACDWTQTLDAPLTEAKRTEYAKYRQDLRDITDQSGYPADINWPVNPATTGE